MNSGGETEIRTQERVAPLPVFKTGAFNRSAISPLATFYNQILLCDLLDYDDENLYKLNQGQPLTIEIKNNTVTELFKNFKYS